MLQTIRDELDRHRSDDVGHLLLTDESFSALDGKAKLSVVLYRDPGSNLEDLKMFPSSIPDLEASQDAVEQAIQRLQVRVKENLPAIKRTKSWWRFW